ncbi:hypothetical protein FPQ18DRAFT_308179 [Pyronema domesticum]|nr:hypothetical protein FPQ18DRAFT_308179 [Pyronema domesticum]
MAALSKLDPNALDPPNALDLNLDDPLGCDDNESDCSIDNDDNDDDSSSVDSFDGDDSGIYKPPRSGKSKNSETDEGIDWPVYDHQTELENARNRGLERARARLPPLPPSPPDFETEQELHMWMLHKFGNVSPEYWKSLEAYYRYGHWFWEDFDEEDEEGYLNNTSLPSMAEVDYPDFSLDITHDLKAAKEEADARVSKRKKKCCEGHAYLWQERNVSRIGIVSVRCKRRSQIQEDIKVKMSPSVRAAIEVLKEEEEARQQAEKEAEEARKQAERETEEKRSANKPESRQVVRGLWNSTDSLHPYQVRHMNKVSHAGTYHSKPWNNYTIG